VAGAVELIIAIATVQAYAPSDGHSRLSAVTFFGIVLVLAPAAIGSVVRTRAALRDRLRASEEARARAESADIATRRAAQLDRVDRAVETVIIAALDRMGPYAAVRELDDITAIRDHGRDALTRMRELVNDLRSDGAAGEPRSPGQKLPELHAEVERVLAGGDRDRTVARRALWTVVTDVHVIDLVLAVAAGTYTLLILAGTLFRADASIQDRIVVSGLAGLSSLSLAWTRRRPVPATAVAMAATVAYTLVAHPADPLDGLVAGLVLIAFPLVTGAASTLREAAAGLALCLGVAVGFGWGRWGDLASSGVLAIGAWLAGRILRTGARALEADARQAARDRDGGRRRLQKALDEDRARVARDLHDAVGHALTGIVLQATAAARVWDSDRWAAVEHATALRRTLAETLDDLRPLVTAIALDEGVPAGESGLQDLVERARRCGLTVELAAPGRVDADTYRIVQEALTNTARYAPGATVTVRLDNDMVEIVNTASPYPVADRGAPRHQRDHHGLRGMAERAAALGGRVEAGPTADGGFRVLALLPRMHGAG
jgi:signal transduction histidine kinase